MPGVFGRKRLEDFESTPARTRRRNRAGACAKRARERGGDPSSVTEEWRSVLVRLNIPAADEVRALSAQVAALDVTIERLRQDGARSGAEGGYLDR